MSFEGQLLDQKSLRAVSGKTADWNEIAKDCVAFANATGGRLLLGIEDGLDRPPPDQRIPAALIHQRIGGEIHPKQVKRALEELIERGAVRIDGNNRWRRYWSVS